MTNEEFISEYNEAQFQIFRLHNIWQECRQASERGDLIAWKWKLNSAEIELNNDARRLDKKKGFLKQLKEINKKIVEIEINFQKTHSPKYLSLLYLKLKEKEELLKYIQDEAGKGARYKLREERM